jgi:YegS/Rv2252/BmrU family lipid kinase
LNPVAGSCDPAAVRAGLDEALGGAGWRLSVFETPAADDLPAQVDAAVGRAFGAGARLAVAAGGDGTIALVASSLVRTGAAAAGVRLGIVPVGTANVFPLEVGIPLDVPAATRLLVEGHREARLDVMRLGERYFINQIGVGLDAKMIHHTDREAQRRLGRGAYALSLARQFVGHSARRFTFEVDGRELTARAWQVVVANAGTLGAPPFRWGPDISPADGQVDLCVFHVGRPLDYLRLLWRFAAGRHREGAKAHYLKVEREVRIDARRPLVVQADGEIVGRTPVTVRVLPRALPMLVPEAGPVAP